MIAHPCKFLNFTTCRRVSCTGHFHACTLACTHAHTYAQAHTIDLQFIQMYLYFLVENTDVNKHLLASLKGALYRIWCGVNRLGDSGVNRLGDISAFVNPAGQLQIWSAIVNPAG